MLISSTVPVFKMGTHTWAKNSDRIGSLKLIINEKIEFSFIIFNFSPVIYQQLYVYFILPLF